MKINCLHPEKQLLFYQNVIKDSLGPENLNNKDLEFLIFITEE